MMIAKKNNYIPGTWFSVPLRKGGYALGVIVSVGDKGVLYGYFFKPKLTEIPNKLAGSISLSECVLKAKFGHLGLSKGRWKIIEKDNEWAKKGWGVEPMVRLDEDASIGFISHYNESLRLISEEKHKISSDLYKYPRDSLLGAGAVEIRLTNILCEQ
ncbi:MAG: hypothetical protein JXR16_02045 [Bermanella sp.]